MGSKRHKRNHSELRDNTITAVLDANVLYPMMLRDTLLRAAGVGCFRVHWSKEILDEVERNLVGDNRMNPRNAARLRRAMEAAFPAASVDGYQRLTPTMRNHVKDRHVAAVAVTTGATMIVTSNIRDFQALPQGIVAVAPDMFLQRLWAEDAALVRSAIERQAGAFMRPKLTPDTIVDRLRTVTPEFADLWFADRERSS
jgi:hypothetical protein